MQAQNLVPNPSFETFSTCPQGFSQFNGYISNWVNPSNASPDYYNICACPNPVCTPGNTTGYQAARSGNAYAGIYTTPGDIYREFIQVQLSSPMQAGMQYQFEMYVSLANKSKTAVDDIGAYFSVTAPTSGGNAYLSGNPQPQICNAYGNVITDTLGWTLISGTYTATGGEQWLTLGHFKNDTACTYLTLPYGNLGAYYFFDDISVKASCCNDSVSFANVVPESCAGGNGGCTAAFHSSCGATPSAYNWSNGIHNASLSNLVSGTYQLTIMDNNGCSASSSVIINHSGSISGIVATATSTSCGDSNGSLTVSVTGGGTFSYLWSNNSTVATINNVTAGTYGVTVTDSSGCSATASAIVDASLALNNVTLVADTSTLCAGDSANICAPAGYSYQWNNGATGECIYATQAGNYYVTITDNNSCTATSNHVPVSFYPQPPVSISVSGDTLLAYNAQAYQWYLDGNLIAGADSGLYIAAMSGSYVVEITDSNGCHAQSLPVVVNVTGINALTGEGTKVFPNPSTDGKWTITGEFSTGAAFEIFDVEGRKIIEGHVTKSKTEIQLNTSPGLYFLRFSDRTNSVTMKLLRL
jgi:hypothetical protein